MCADMQTYTTLERNLPNLNYSSPLFHHVLLSSLRPNTTYYYRASVPGLTAQRLRAAINVLVGLVQYHVHTALLIYKDARHSISPYVFMLTANLLAMSSYVICTLLLWAHVSFGEWWLAFGELCDDCMPHAVMQLPTQLAALKCTPCVHSGDPASGQTPLLTFNVGVVSDVGQTANSSLTMQRLAESKPQAFLFVGDWTYADNSLTNGMYWVLPATFLSEGTGIISCYQEWVQDADTAQL